MKILLRNNTINNKVCGQFASILSNKVIYEYLKSKHGNVYVYENCDGVITKLVDIDNMPEYDHNIEVLRCDYGDNTKTELLWYTTTYKDEYEEHIKTKLLLDIQRDDQQLISIFEKYACEKDKSMFKVVEIEDGLDYIIRPLSSENQSIEKLYVEYK